MGRDRKKNTGQSVFRQMKGKKRRKTITCRVCGARLKVINHVHLSTHGMTTQEYREKFGVQYMASEELRYRFSVKYTKRTPDDILKSIRELASSGTRLYSSEIRHSHYKLHVSASYTFGTWLNAVEAAGLDPKVHTKPHPSKHWSRSKAIREIRNRHAQGLPMHQAGVERDNQGLAYAGIKYFGSWRAALKAVGINPKDVLYGSKWSKRRIIRTILARAAEGKPINSRHICLHEGPLWAAAGKRFGNWENTLRAAGIDPDDVRKFRIWGDNKTLLAEIRRHAETGLPMNSASMEKRDSGLLAIAVKRFGSWDNALMAAGLNPRDCRARRKPYTPEEIIETIEFMWQNGQPLCHVAVKSSSIYPAAVRFFGSWDAALREAGLDPKKIRRSNPSDAKEVLEWIRKRAKEGKPVNYMEASKSGYHIVNAGRKLFGSWTDALMAAGIDGHLVNKNHKRWDRITITETLLRRKADGLPLNPYAVSKVIPLDSVSREFGSYKNALSEIGINPAEIYLMREWTDESILQAIRLRHEEGKSLFCSHVQREDLGLLSCSISRFGSWSSALAAAGFNPKEHRGNHPKWTRESVIQSIREQIRPGERLSCTRVKPRSAHTAALRIFGSWQAALDAVSNQEQDAQ